MMLELTLRSRVRTALDTVLDPELDEPITDLGFVRSIEVDGVDGVPPAGGDGGNVVVHLRLPTSFCSPNFAWLMASDAYDAVVALDGVGAVEVQLDDHHDSDKINTGLAAGAGYRGTFGSEAEDSLDELRMTFRRKAHTAAMERCLTALLRERPDLSEEDVAGVRLGDLPDSGLTERLRQRRRALGLDDSPSALVLVDAEGRTSTRAEAPKRLRMARSVRISIDGNAHFCRGLLATRYPGADADQAPSAHDTLTAAGRPLLPLGVKQ
jgi:metal-sulfur cluster biosynthetic enzyme